MRPRDTADLAGSAGLGAWTAFAVLGLVVGGHGTPLSVDDTLLSWSLDHRPAVAVAVARGRPAPGAGVLPDLVVALGGVGGGRPARPRAGAAA
ncbi:phosphatase PAP2 family protein, partial [Streptomyces sp. NPDC001212]